MKRIVKKSLLFSSLVTTMGCAFATPQSDAQLKSQVQSLTAQTQELQKEVKALEVELHHRAQVQNVVKVEKVVQVVHEHHEHPVPVAAEPEAEVAEGPVHATHKLYPEYDISPFRHPVTVTTSPFMGLRSAYDASDLMQMDPSVNQDIVLLKDRRDLETSLKAEGLDIDRPIVEISGAFEGQVYDTGGFGVGMQDHGIAVSTADLDVNAVASDWANAYFSFAFDNSPASLGSRQPKDTLFLKRGFATIGDLNVFPLYMSMGQMYVPFGRYSSAILSTPVTMSLARIRTNVLSLGFVKNDLFGAVFGYSGFQTSLGTPYIKQWGADLGLQHHFTEKYSIDFRASAVTNIADAEGMQNNGSGPPGTIPFFTGFGQPLIGGAIVTADNLQHNVAGIDFNGAINLSKLSLLGEYAGASQRFNSLDMTFNNHGATPQSMHTEADYSFLVNGKPCILGGAYEHTWESFALNLPETSWIGVFSVSLWKDTIESIEYRHDTNYARGTIGTGANTPLNYPSGGTRNSVIGQLGVYF